MSRERQITLLPSGPKLSSLVDDPDVARWAFWCTGQVVLNETPAPPSSVAGGGIVEPLGGGLMHLLARPSLKQIGIPHLPSRTRILHDALQKYAALPGFLYHESILRRDLFGLRAVDYAPELIVLVGMPTEQSVSAHTRSKKSYRGILSSLTNGVIQNTDLFHGLSRIRAVTGFDLFPGISTLHPRELRRTLLDYHDSVRAQLGKTRQ